MPTEAARVTIPVSTNADKATGDFKQLNRELGKTDKATDKTTKAFETLKQVGIAALAAVAARAVARLGVSLVQAASDAAETASKFAVVFQGIDDDANAATRNLVENFGLAESSAQDLLSATGDLLTGFGFSRESALDLSEQVQTLAVDLASFTNFSGGAEGASEALTKALLGERESVKALGISIMEADIQQLAEDQGIVGELTRQQKAMLTLQIAVQQSANSLGDYARTSEGTANQQRALAEDVKGLAETFGNQLLPVADGVIAAARSMVGFFTDLDESTKTLIVSMGLAVPAVAAVALGIFGAVKAVSALRTAMTLLAAHPIVGVLTLLGIALAAVATKFIQTRIEGDRMNTQIRATRDAARQAAQAIRELTNEEELRILTARQAAIQDELASSALAFQARLFERTGNASAALARELVDLKRIETEIAILRTGDGREAQRAEFDLLVQLRGQLDRNVLAEGLLLIAIQQRINALDVLLKSQGVIADEDERAGEATRTLAEELALLQLKYDALGGDNGPINLVNQQMSLYRGAIEDLLESGIDPQNQALQVLIEHYAELAAAIAVTTEATVGALSIEEALALKRAAIRAAEKSAAEAALVAELNRRNKQREALVLNNQAAAAAAAAEIAAAEEIRKAQLNAAMEIDRANAERRAAELDGLREIVAAREAAAAEAIKLARDQAAQQKELLQQQLAFTQTFANSVFQIFQNLADKRGQTDRESAQRAQRFALFEVLIATAVAISKAGLNPFAIAAAVALGAAQATAVATQPIPAAQHGGTFTVPPGFSGDSGLVRVNSGEDVSVSPSRDSGGQSMPSTIVVRIGDREFAAAVEDSFNRGGAQIRNPNAVKIGR